MNGSFDTAGGPPPGDNNKQRKFLKVLVILFIIGLLVVLSLGAFMLFQTRDLWLDTQPKTLSPTDLEATSTATCNAFITEFPGTPCP